ncbi:MAG: patatin-like phospholipase family protein [Salinibacter sp.]|uniref:patatin-like phospholipase family protein n=1 Tax=Salinibacter sp. TaxID=2065818 RepID=UPI0035D50B82
MLKALRRYWTQLLGTTRQQPPTPGILLTGGGARSAYQAGVIRYIAEAFPEAYFPIQTGVSAGAINAAHLGNHTGTFRDAAQHVVDAWTGRELEDIIVVESRLSLLWDMLWDAQAASPEEPTSANVRSTHGLLDTTPLSETLHDHLDEPDGTLSGVRPNLAEGRLRALAVVTTDYATGQTVTWVQGEGFDAWERPDRIGRHTQLTVDHVMASSALPLVFPAVRIGGSWYGDGGIRLSAPLAPAVHLGADKILAISTQYSRSQAESEEIELESYPSTSQIVGVLMNSIFLDSLPQDAHTMHRINTLVEELPAHRRHGMRPLELLQIRPSVDLDALAHDYRDQVPSPIQTLTSGLGTRERESPDWLSVLLFHPGYIEQLLEIGYGDAQDTHDQLEAFLADTAAGAADPPGLRRCDGALPASDEDDNGDVEPSPSASAESP